MNKQTNETNILREWTHDIKCRERQCNAMDEWHEWMNAMAWTFMNWKDSTLKDMNDINCNELNSKPITWNEVIHNITQLYIYTYIYMYIAKHKIPQQEIHEITYNYVHGMHWHEWIDDMNELMMKYLNEMTTMKDMNTCMKWTTLPDMKWHEMT